MESILILKTWLKSFFEFWQNYKQKMLFKAHLHYGKNCSKLVCFKEQKILCIQKNPRLA
jgi:hypothetical protein